MMAKFTLLFISSLLLVQVSKAQGVAPYTWKFEANKTATGNYSVHCTVDVKSPWHIYSQFTPEGGPVRTQFSFLKNPLCSLDGQVVEDGKMITKHEAVFGVDVKYFEDHVDFVQKIILKGNAKTNFSGSVTFMVCNDVECLPPTTLKFTVALN